MANLVGNWISYQLKEKKLNTPFGWVLMALWGLAIAYTTVNIDYQLTGIFLIAIMGVYVLLICLRYPLIGLYFTIIFSSFFAVPGRLINVPSPIGLLVELLTYFLWIAVLGGHASKSTDNSAFWKNNITLGYLAIFSYYLLEIANPSMNSLQGWIFFFRKQISFILFYYICYVLMNSYARIQSFIKFWIILVVAIAAYGVKQQWFGLSWFEKNWLVSDPVAMGLFFQGGFLRKFSILTDPAAFGVICAAFSLLTLILAIRLKNRKTKFLLFLSTIILLLGSSYSGSRTCNLMIVAGLFAYAIFTLNERRTYTLMIVSFFVSILLLFGPFQYNPVIYRIKSTFYSSKDASSLLRDFNRARIQPYIYTHPIGGGLNTSGSEGIAYNPGHPLSAFPPDSGYLKILIEQGWIGLAIHLIFYFIFLKKGLDGFYQAKNPHIKNLYIALTVCMFSIVVGQYSQVAIAQYPLMLFYFSALVILDKLIKYDKSNVETNAI